MMGLCQVYALRRLARGLASSHDAARQGFALALAAALARVPEIESLPALDLLDAALEVSKSMKVVLLIHLSSHGADLTENIIAMLAECTFYFCISFYGPIGCYGNFSLAPQMTWFQAG